MEKVLIKQKTEGNEWIALVTTILFFAGTILIFISKLQNKKYAFTWIIIVFLLITLFMSYITFAIFKSKDVLVEKNNKLYLRGLFGAVMLEKEDIVQVTKISATNEIKLNIHHGDRNVEQTYLIKELSDDFINTYMTKK